jgi:Protein of unknown function (DUF4058)
MPPRFPGIDPYLEAQDYWPDFHSTYIVTCREAIASRLPDHYEARIDERIRLVDLSDAEAKDFLPDVAVSRRAMETAHQVEAVAVLELEPVMIPRIILEEVRETFIRVIHRTDRKLVTVVELLSPDNKAGTGYGAYMAKRDDLCRGEVHLVELDFLAGGHRMPMAGPLPPGDAFAIVARWNRRPVCEVYPWSIRRPLPTIRFPLLAPEPDVALDLAAIFATTFERGRYARSIDYQAPLAIGLNPEDRAWAEALAKAP